MCHFPAALPGDEVSAVAVVVDAHAAIPVSAAMLPLLVAELVEYMTPEQKRALANSLAKELAVGTSVTFTEPPDRPGDDE